MRLVKFYDDDGYLRQVHARNSDTDEEARETGIAHNPPDLSQIDWKEVERELNNLLVERGLITWIDVQKGGDSLTSAIKTVMKRKIIALYRQKV